MDTVEFTKRCRIVKASLKGKSLAKALFHLEVLARLEPNLFAKDYDKLRDIRTNYDRMLEYASFGVADDKTQVYFSKYLEYTYAIVQNVLLQQLISQDSVFKASYKRALKIGSSDIQSQLALVAEKEKKAFAMWAEENSSADACKSIYKETADYRNRLFSYILVSPQWTSAEKTDMISLVTSSSTDEISAQMMVSAIMLACLTIFDYQKFLALLDIYKGTSNIKIKEKALIAIGLCAAKDDFYKDYITEILNNECNQDPAFLKELVDLQKQIIICLDTKKIDHFLKSNMKQNEKDIQKLYNALKNAQDENRLGETLNFGEQQEIFDKLYQGVEKTLHLEKSGYDTEYESFALLKNIAFFHSLVNWFTPFYYENPNLADLTTLSKNGCHIFEIIKSMTAITDCGSYALAYAFMQHYNSVVSSVAEKKISDKIEVDKSKRKKPKTPSDFRLLFLRDIYRFFTLSPLNTFAPEVFDVKKGNDAPVFFMLQHKLNSNIYDKAIKNICRFLYKRNDFQTLSLFLKNVEEQDEEFCMFTTIVALKLNKGIADAVPYAERIYKNHPDNQSIARLLPQLYTQNLDFQKVVDIFELSNIWNPKEPDTSILLPKALDKMGKHDDALQKLFELYYNNPQNIEVLDVLWRTLFFSGNIEKAYQIIQKLEALEPVAAKGLFYEYKMVEAFFLLQKGQNKEAFSAFICSFKKFENENLEAVMFNFQVVFDKYACKLPNLTPLVVQMLRERVCQYVYEHLSDFTENTKNKQ